jgi:hypothetical protein
MPIFQGDNNRIIQFETNEDLTNCTSVVVTLERPDGTIFTKSAVILDTIKGKCKFILSSDDLTISGDYEYQWTITFDDGTIESDLIYHLNIREKLGDTHAPVISSTAYVGSATVGTSTVA